MLFEMLYPVIDPDMTVIIRYGDDKETRIFWYPIEIPMIFAKYPVVMVSGSENEYGECLIIDLAKPD